MGDFRVGNDVCPKCLAAHPPLFDCEAIVQLLPMPNNPGDTVMDNTVIERVRGLYQRRHELTEAEWLEAAPVLLGLAVAALTPVPDDEDATLLRAAADHMRELDARLKEAATKLQSYASEIERLRRRCDAYERKLRSMDIELVEDVDAHIAALAPHKEDDE